MNPDHLEPVTHRENVLRGSSFMATRAVQRECANGHEWTAENTYYRANGTRQCRGCNRENQIKRKALAKAGLLRTSPPPKEQLGRAKLTEQDVRDIRAAHAAGEYAKDIAKRYSVNAGSVGHIVHGITWRHVA